MKTDIKVKNWQLRKVKCTDASVDLSQKEFVAVEKRAFSNRGNRKYTEQVILPKGVSVLKAEAFSACTRLKQITLPADNNVGISGGVFQNCCRLRTVNNSGVIQSIGARAFFHCDMLQEIELGSDLRRIGEEAFRGCRSVRRIDLPPSLREIGKGAFRDGADAPADAAHARKGGLRAGAAGARAGGDSARGREAGRCADEGRRAQRGGV